MDFEVKEKSRYLVLAKLYELTGGNRRQRIRGEKLQEATGLETRDYRNTLQYLVDEGLANRINLIVEITHAGILEYEASLARPEESTAHFSTQIIQHFHAPVGVVQTGSQASAVVMQGEGIVEQSSQESMTITFVDWCSQVLDVLIKESEKDPYAWTEGIDEHALFRLLFKVEEIEDFHGSNQRHGTQAALGELAKLGFLETG